MSYDAWLESPYQHAYAMGDAAVEILERWEEDEETVVCEGCEVSQRAADVGAEVTDLDSWRQGRYGGYTATIEWKCTAVSTDDDGEPFQCDHNNKIKLEEDNL